MLVLIENHILMSPVVVFQSSEFRHPPLARFLPPPTPNRIIIIPHPNALIRTCTDIISLSGHLGKEIHLLLRRKFIWPCLMDSLTSHDFNYSYFD